MHECMMHMQCIQGAGGSRSLLLVSIASFNLRHLTPLPTPDLRGSINAPTPPREAPGGGGQALPPRARTGWTTVMPHLDMAV